MTNDLFKVAEVNTLIKEGKKLILAGSEKLLTSLEKGDWIGGTIPYFMGDEGGCFSEDKIFVNDITQYVKQYKIITYNSEEVDNLSKNSFDNGFNYLLLPAFSEVHSSFAMKCHSLDGLFNNPLLGWITGVNLSEVGKVTPKVINGNDLKIYEDRGIAFHAALFDNKVATVEIINIFEPNLEGDLITFNEDGFECSDCIINGKTVNFSEYLIDNSIDTQLPIVADYSGAKINISIQAIEKENKLVKFYAPVQKGVEYHFAKPIEDYVTTFMNNIPKGDDLIVSSFNCILNYIYPELEGKKTGKFKGPFTFGEIAYILVNQTLVYLSITDA